MTEQYRPGRFTASGIFNIYPKEHCYEKKKKVQHTLWKGDMKNNAIGENLEN